MYRAVGLDERAGRHAALGDPARLAIVDELSVSDRAPVELRRLLGMESNLLAHHLDVLERVGLIERSRSSGDGRRRYVHLLRGTRSRASRPADRPARVPRCSCAARTRHARSWLPRLWRQATGEPADVGGHPSRRAGSTPARSPPRRRAGLDLDVGHAAGPRATIESFPPLVVTVCDRAHEELDPDDTLAALVDPRPGPGRHRRPRSTPRWPSCATGSAHSSRVAEAS